jgi:hypothetical protein
MEKFPIHFCLVYLVVRQNNCQIEVFKLKDFVKNTPTLAPKHDSAGSPIISAESCEVARCERGITQSWTGRLVGDILS